ncbi:MAG: EAL domain-containing protein [Rhodocyclaceae bacterium]|nr:EAL domain-containing protein [Rhodocyclaceae bacterium]
MTTKAARATSPAQKRASPQGPATAAARSRPAAKASKSASANPSDNSLFYVGIGASAGGLEALRPFVAALPDHANMTYLVAQHMSPAHRSMMVELLARETGLRVEEASNHRVPKADTIYVAPPNADLTVVKGKLRISKPTNTIGPRPSVDRFLISLADDQEDRAIGIILSGTGSDGARGIKAIKAAGGISIAQEPKSAKYDSMPTAAIRAGGADLVLPPQEIANQLSAIVQRPRPPIVVEAEEEPPSTILGLVRQIRVTTGMDFSNYKESTLSRQVLRRMAAMQIPSLEAYGSYIASNRNELTELAGNFLICVTSFFRDPEAFDALRKLVVDMLAAKSPGDEIRVWVPGCATGEEVYSIAILVAEALGNRCDRYRIQIFATDINGEAVSSARAGIFPEAALSGMDAALVARYFTADEGLYQIDRSLREMILFARQDLVQDPPFVRLDLISCRNLLIYFKSELQERVMKIFHYALHEGGILFLGKSESVGRLGTLFAERDRKNKIYVRRMVPSPAVGGFSQQREHGADAGAASPRALDTRSLTTIGQDRLFELYAPASMLMTATGEILEVYGECGDFLGVRKGRADFNAFSLIKEAFRAELRAFAHRVARSRKSAQSSAIEVSLNGEVSRWRVTVHYAGDTGSNDGCLLLVCFEAADERAGDHDAQGADPGREARIAELEQEVVLNRENLQTVIEELETANEELQALNEEAQASNEELQASNEELETANEELQASNEELITVNDELGTRSGELADINDDLKNVVESMQQGLVVVDSRLAITRYNRNALDFFNIAADASENLTSVRTRCRIPALIETVRDVIDHGRQHEIEFSGNGNQTYLMRLAPYLATGRKRVNGAVLMIVNVTEKKSAEEQLRLSASVFEYGSEAAMITDAANKIVAVNPAFTRITGYLASEVIGRTPHILSSGEHSREFYDNLWQTIDRKGCWQGEIKNRRKNGQNYVEHLSINVIRDASGKIHRHIGVFRDITDIKLAQQTIERQATYDSLTGLANRNLTLDRMGQVLAAARRSGTIFAVLFLDLDNFKSINDALGHAAGDELLVETAKRIRSVLRESDSVGRMGGDEFIVLLGNLKSVDDVVPIADKILARLHEPVVIQGSVVRAPASIGITVYPMDGDTPEVLLKNADSAMYEAKKLGRNKACFFTNRLQDEANRRHWINSELEIAVDADHLAVHYQPIIHLETMTLAGAEALLRWKHPAKGYISPEVFIPVAEQNGMISRLSEWILRVGLADWRDEVYGLSLAFNLSAAQFVAKDHIDQMLMLLDKSDLARGGKVTLEITESLKLSDSEEFVDIFRRLNGMGCSIAVDDFGTGFSSLSYLKRMPVRIIKIDRSFVSDITSDETDAATIKAIVQLANAFGMQTVAEGVETPEQLEFLRQQGCTYAQGFLFSEPLPIDEFREYVAAHAEGISQPAE